MGDLQLAGSTHEREVGRAAAAAALGVGIHAEQGLGALEDEHVVLALACHTRKALLRLPYEEGAPQAWHMCSYGIWTICEEGFGSRPRP